MHYHNYCDGVSIFIQDVINEGWSIGNELHCELWQRVVAVYSGVRADPTRRSASTKSAILLTASLAQTGTKLARL